MDHSTSRKSYKLPSHLRSGGFRKGQMVLLCASNGTGRSSARDLNLLSLYRESGEPVPLDVQARLVEQGVIVR